MLQTIRACSLALLLAGSAAAADLPLAPLLEKVRGIGPKGAGHREAIEAWKTLAQADARQLPEILAGMDSSNLLAANWIRAACETVAQRATDAPGGKLPIADLEKFLASPQYDPLARRLAYELIAKVDKGAEARLIPGLMHDTSLELRRDAVALALQKAEAAGTADKAAAIKVYREIFVASRDHDQIKTSTDKLRELGEKVDVATHYGFLMQWQIVAPFENAGKKGFDVAYPPETEIKLGATYDGKAGQIGWKSVTTKSDQGVVDLNASLDKHKGAIAYAYATFVSPREQAVELRLGTPNANKIWLNGELLTTNNIYHANTAIDQYTARGKLVAGRNTILLKIAQNEQTENWAQDWKFQLRVCDKIGTAVLSQDRPSEQTASVR